jgi:hypothetical protein
VILGTGFMLIPRTMQVFQKKIQDTLNFFLAAFPSRLCNKNPAKNDTLGGIFEDYRADLINVVKVREKQ